MRQVVSFVSTLYSVSRPNEYARFSTVANWRNIYRFRADKADVVFGLRSIRPMVEPPRFDPPQVGPVYRNTTPATPAQNRVRFRVRVSACHILRRCGRCSISIHPVGRSAPRNESFCPTYFVPPPKLEDFPPHIMGYSAPHRYV